MIRVLTGVQLWEDGVVAVSPIVDRRIRIASKSIDKPVDTVRHLSDMDCVIN